MKTGNSSIIISKYLVFYEMKIRIYEKLDNNFARIRLRHEQTVHKTSPYYRHTVHVLLVIKRWFIRQYYSTAQKVKKFQLWVSESYENLSVHNMLWMLYSLSSVSLTFAIY